MRCAHCGHDPTAKAIEALTDQVRLLRKETHKGLHKIMSQLDDAVAGIQTSFAKLWTDVTAIVAGTGNQDAIAKINALKVEMDADDENLLTPPQG